MTRDLFAMALRMSTGIVHRTPLHSSYDFVIPTMQMLVSASVGVVAL